MISTVTTTTVTTIVTLTGAASLGALATILLISLLGTQEVATADKRRMIKGLGKRLNVSILPLIVVFSLIVAMKAFELIV